MKRRNKHNWHLWKSTKGSLITLAIFMAFTVYLGNIHANLAIAQTQASMASSIIAQKNNQISELEQYKAELEAMKAKYPNPTQQEIEDYIRLIFGKDARVAIAISHHECGTWDKRYPKCHLKSQVENSIGVFQINLHNSQHWVHAGRIPGVTMAEKELWLENPFNNTLYAYWVYKTSSWEPWSSYTNKSYLQDL